MIAVGTKEEHFKAIWVRNEWSRYLAMIKSGAKKVLIPAYKDMDPYELPEEFSHLQAQDMGKIGFINDVVRGIQKVIKKDEPKVTVVKETVVTGGNANEVIVLPPMEKVIGTLNYVDVIAGGHAGSLREDGSIEAELQVITGATNEMGFNRLSAR